MDRKTVPSDPRLIGDLLDIIHNAIIVVNSQDQIVLANSRTAEMFGTGLAGLQGVAFASLFMPEDREILVTNILSLTRKNREFECEGMLRRPDGTTFLGLISGTSFQWDTKREGMAFTIHDLTHMKAIEASLKHSERIAFLGRLVDDISHQIRNPVMVIGGFARRLHVDGCSPKYTDLILKEAEQLEQLLDTLNHFTKLRHPKPVRLSMTDFITLAETVLREKVESRDCHWDGQYCESLLGEDFLIDVNLLVEALDAVLVNACESYNGMVKEKRTVTFEVDHSEKIELPYVIRVIDYGTGIEKAVYPNIFGHFFTTKTKHTGMGLTIAQRIVEEQRGTLTVASEPGKGTCASFHLMKERRRPIRTTRL